MIDNPSNPQIERQIVIGLIVSTEYLIAIKPIWDIQFIDATPAQKISQWCWEYFDKYKEAPNAQIETIFHQNKKRLQEEEAEFIEDVLTSVSEEYDREQFNVRYLLDETLNYFKAQQLIEQTEKIKEEIESGELLRAETLLSDFSPIQTISSSAVRPLGSTEQIKSAFQTFSNPLISYGDTALGKLLHQAMQRDCLVGLMGQNKSGKTFRLMELGLRASKQGNNVVFFQAGDLSQEQMERRIAIYYAQKSDMAEYCGELLIPVIDCAYNQNGECMWPCEDSSPVQPFSGKSIENIRSERPNDTDGNISADTLKEAFEEYPEHTTCYNCLRSKKRQWNFKGTLWYRQKAETKPLTWKESLKILQRKHTKTLDRFKLITYPNEGLTIQKIDSELELLAREGFVADVVLIDYADILAPDSDCAHLQPRDQVNKKWQRARRLSQERHCLVVMATQSDAQGFDAYLLQKKHFSEDRRILDHVTAMFGLNATADERAKGIIRINDIVGRDTAGGRVVRVLQRLEIGRPMLGSFF